MPRAVIQARVGHKAAHTAKSENLAGCLQEVPTVVEESKPEDDSLGGLRVGPDPRDVPIDRDLGDDRERYVSETR